MNRPTPQILGNRLRINDTWFDLDITRSMMERQSTEDGFLLVKTPEMISNLLARLEGRAVENIFDLGIFKGGSVALYNELFSPKRLVAVDIQQKRNEMLDLYVSRGRKQVLTLYGIDQSDSGKMRSVLREEFGDARLDLVVDDASHLYEHTLASFNVLFPALRPGGLYVIEDWAWSHWPGDEWQKPKGYFRNRQPLSRLVFEIVMTCASSSEGIVKAVHVTGNTVFVERGNAVLPADWDVTKAFLSQGRPWGPERYFGLARRIKRLPTDAVEWAVRLAKKWLGQEQVARLKDLLTGKK